MGTQGCSTNGIEGKGIGNFDRDVRYEGRGKTLQEAIDNLPTLHTEMTPDWEYVSDKEAQYILAKIKFAL
jgi:SHS2 domain-containing protein